MADTEPARRPTSAQRRLTTLHHAPAHVEPTLSTGQSPAIANVAILNNYRIIKFF
jgi:hypothetical protein